MTLQPRRDHRQLRAQVECPADLAEQCGIRHARYRGLPKTALEHNLAATAINVIRLDAYWTGRPLDRTRSSHLARLDFTTAA